MSLDNFFSDGSFCPAYVPRMIFTSHSKATNGNEYFFQGLEEKRIRVQRGSAQVATRHGYAGVAVTRAIFAFLS